HKGVEHGKAAEDGVRSVARGEDGVDRGLDEDREVGVADSVVVVATATGNGTAGAGCAARTSIANCSASRRTGPGAAAARSGSSHGTDVRDRPPAGGMVVGHGSLLNEASEADCSARASGSGLEQGGLTSHGFEGRHALTGLGLGNVR